MSLEVFQQINIRRKRQTANQSDINKQTIKEVATIRPAVSSNSMQESDSHVEICNEIIQAANQPPRKVPICYSVNQIELLQTPGNYTFATQYQTDKFLWKVFSQDKKPDQTKITRLATLGGKNWNV